MKTMGERDDRILTTHVGSLPRPDSLVGEITEAGGRSGGGPQLEGRVRSAIQDVVGRQSELGIDIASDGEAGKVGFMNYVASRLDGVHIETTTGFAATENVPTDIQEYPEISTAALAGATQLDNDGTASVEVMVNDGPIRYIGHDDLRADLADFRAALDGVSFTDAFIPSISPGSAAAAMMGNHIADPLERIEAVGAALSEEYRAIVDAGFMLQIDAPDFGSKHMMPDLSVEQFREMVTFVARVLNSALEGIDPARVRLHVCWGNYVGPHHLDLPLADVIDIAYSVNANGLAIEAANPRHQHEWRVFRDSPLPAGKYLMPGVIDVCTAYIEHPQVVADRIDRFTSLVGRNNVVACTDCGFGTQANRRNVPTDLVYAKLGALVEGARLASQQPAMAGR